jgi:signal transduction histidine kinase
VKILVTGKQGRLLKVVASALGQPRGFSTQVLPLGPRFLSALSKFSPAGLLVTLASGEEVEAIRWILQQDRSLPVVALLPRKQPGLRKQLLAEGVCKVVELAGMGAPHVRRAIATALNALRSKVPHDKRQIVADMHAIRSPLTAILGNAELALKHASRTGPHRRQLQEIFRGVAEIEVILRRLDRVLKAGPNLRKRS